MNTSIQKLFDLSGRVAVITGGAGLLGKQHAAALAESGCRVELWDINAESLEAAKQILERDHSGKISTQVVDIASHESILAGAKALEKKHGRLDILINNAGMTVARGQEKFKRYFDPFETYPIELWEMALQVNLTGTFLVTQALAPMLLKSGAASLEHDALNAGASRPTAGASIINIASDVGVISPDHRIYQPNTERDYKGANFNSPLSYATSKAALIHMTKFWATYWAKSGVRVNSISPAGVANNQDPAFVRELVDRIPLGRMAHPHEYKGAIAFLASDASSFMTGHNLIIDGGRTIW